MLRRRLLAAGTAVLALGAVIGVANGSNAATVPAATPSGATGGVVATTITLVTGDRVHVSAQPDGDVAVAIERAPGREDITFQHRKTRDGTRTDLTVIPSDAAALIAADRLDSRLFNVTGLAREGYADAVTTAVPLIVRYSPGVAVRAAAPATQVVRALPSINGASWRTDKRQAGQFWNWLTGGPGAGVHTLAAGISRVWLNGRRHTMLDVSAPQIGTPVARAAGLTGAGVTVGILDTGVKGDHPDLAGKVVEQRDFTDTLPGGGDDDGHGTHVAGIIAGTGAASGGRFTGIAPDAKLIVGKVCETNTCPDDAIIAGMEWIAPQVKTVNMSLGGGSSDGTDPMDLALDNLSAQHGTLFVVAAGNSRGADRVASPASANAALAVGSVTKQDQTSTFSSAGPRVGDGAVKPDIAGPGTAIVAARAIGTPTGDTDPVETNYTRLSGTSMAAPHVAGAAALLQQQHPDWTVTRLKPTLMSTAKPTSGVFDQGAGRVDVGRAATQQVTATSGSLNFGFFAWPHTQPPVTKTVSYRNDGDTPATLSLGVAATGPDGQPAPAGLFTTSASQVTVPAKGTADVGLVLTPMAAAIGQFGGRLTATANGITVQTAFSANLEPESFNLTVNVTTRGNLRYMFGATLDVATGHVGDIFEFGSPSAVVRLPRGRHDVYVYANSSDPANTAQPTIATLLARPNVQLDADTTITLDGTAARPVSAVVDRAGAVRQFGSFDVGGTSRSGTTTGVGADAPRSNQMFALPTSRVTDHPFGFFFRAVMGVQTPGVDPAGFVYNLAFVRLGQVPADLTFRVRDRELATVDSRYHVQGTTSEGLRGSSGRLPIVGNVPFRLFPHPLPSRRTELYTAHPDVVWLNLLVVTTAEAQTSESQVSLRTHRPGTEVAGWNRAPLGPAFGTNQGWGVVRDGKQLEVAVPLFSGSDPHQYSEPRGVTGTTTLSRNGVVIGTSEQPGAGTFDIPDAAGTYTLRTTAERTVPWSVVGTRTDVTWRFREPGAAATIRPLPLSVVRAIGPVDDQGQARAGRAFPLGLLVQRQPGAPASRLVDLRVEASFDDGATWTTVRTKRIGDNGVAVIKHPAHDGFVSLRITARDAAGNSVRQTMIRAYQIVNPTTAPPI